MRLSQDRDCNVIQKGIWIVILWSESVCTSCALGAGLTASWGSGAFLSVSVKDAPVSDTRPAETHTFSHTASQSVQYRTLLHDAIEEPLTSEEPLCFTNASSD